MSINKNYVCINKKSVISKLIVLILLILISISIAFYFRKKMEKYIITYSTVQMKKIFDISLIKSNNKFEDNYLKYEYDNSGRIISFVVDNEKSNTMLSRLTKSIDTNIKIEEKKYYNKVEKELKISPQKYKNNKSIMIICMPLGVLTNNLFFSDIGKVLPIKIQIIKNISSKLRTKVKDYGINNTLIEIYADIEISGQIILPSSKKQVKINTNILIASQLIQGDVPDLYTNYK